MGLAEAAFKPLLEVPIMDAELRVAIAIGMMSPIFLPQELQGHALALQLLVEGRAIR